MYIYTYIHTYIMYVCMHYVVKSQNSGKSCVATKIVLQRHHSQNLRRIIYAVIHDMTLQSAQTYMKPNTHWESKIGCRQAYTQTSPHLELVLDCTIYTTKKHHSPWRNSKSETQTQTLTQNSPTTNCITSDGRTSKLPGLPSRELRPFAAKLRGSIPASEAGT